jgi:hypothetical protein
MILTSRMNGSKSSRLQQVIELFNLAGVIAANYL